MAAPDIGLPRDNLAAGEYTGGRRGAFIHVASVIEQQMDSNAGPVCIHTRLNVNGWEEAEERSDRRVPPVN